MANGRYEKLLDLYDKRKHDIFNTCMHLSKYDRENALKLMKQTVAFLISSYERGEINGKGIDEKLKSSLLEINENTTENDVTELLDYKNSRRRSERIDQLQRTTEKLPDSQREIIEKHYLSGKSYEQIAKDMKKNPGALRTMVCRTMAKLKSELQIS